MIPASKLTIIIYLCQHLACAGHFIDKQEMIKYWLDREADMQGWGNNNRLFQCKISTNLLKQKDWSTFFKTTWEELHR